MEETEATGVPAEGQGKEGGMIDEEFQERMVKLLDNLIANKSPADRTLTAIIAKTGLDRTTVNGLAMYALAKRWLKIEPVGSANIHVITRLGRKAFVSLKSGAQLSTL